MMISIIKKSLQLSAMAMFFLITMHGAIADRFLPEIQPTPEYLPGEVVGIQMRALGKNDQPFDDAGIELTFRFASPSNKASTGPLSRFTNLFSNPAYKPMLNHTLLEIGQAEIRENQARVPVMIETPDGSRMVYLFMLSRQSQEPYVDCWMTDSVNAVKIAPTDESTLM